jgi:hypothetical protein
MICQPGQYFFQLAMHFSASFGLGFPPNQH